MWSPFSTKKKSQEDESAPRPRLTTFHCAPQASWAERQMTPALLVEMEAALVAARLDHARQGFRATRQVEIDMETDSLRRIADLAACVVFSRAQLGASSSVDP